MGPSNDRRRQQHTIASGPGRLFTTSSRVSGSDWCDAATGSQSSTPRGPTWRARHRRWDADGPSRGSASDMETSFRAQRLPRSRASRCSPTRNGRSDERSMTGFGASTERPSKPHGVTARSSARRWPPGFRRPARRIGERFTLRHHAIAGDAHPSAGQAQLVQDARVRKKARGA